MAQDDDDDEQGGGTPIIIGGRAATPQTAPELAYKHAIKPGLALLPPAMTSPEAVVMLLAIGLQESRFMHRRQIKGPARGFWQFERSGVRGVMMHPSTIRTAWSLLAEYEMVTTAHERLETDDPLAAAFARLLLWTDKAPLPAIGDVDGAWDYYARNWRPGKPHPQTWPELYGRAVAVAAKVGVL